MEAFLITKKYTKLNLGQKSIGLYFKKHLRFINSIYCSVRAAFTDFNRTIEKLEIKSLCVYLTGLTPQML